MARSPLQDAVWLEVAEEVHRQDQAHPSGYPATRDGIFLGIKTAVHELDREAIGAWSRDRCPCQVPNCGHYTWSRTRGEIIQAVAVLLRTVRSIDAHEPTDVSHPEAGYPIGGTPEQVMHWREGPGAEVGP